MAFIKRKDKVAQNEKWEKQLWGFVYVYKIWQILKRFAGTFCRAQTLKLGEEVHCLLPFFLTIN